MRAMLGYARLFGILSTLGVFAGCSAATVRTAGDVPEAVQAGIGRGVIDDVARGFTTGRVYVSTLYPAHTNLFAPPHPGAEVPSCTIATDLAFGIGVDSAGTLWIPQQKTNRVTTYRKGTCQASDFTLREPNGQPTDIGFSTDGKVYVADGTGKGSGPGLISVYAKGSTTPSSTLTDPSIQTPLGIAVNARGDVFLSYFTAKGVSAVIRFRGGRMPGDVLPLQNLGLADGLEFDAAQNLILIDFAHGVDVFAPPYRGAPTRFFAVRGDSRFGKLDRSGQNIYLSDVENRAIDVYRYPSGTFEYTFSEKKYSVPIGIAVDPSV
jgi:hypothetical protein